MEEKKYKELFNKLKSIKDKKEYLDELIKLIEQILYERTWFVKNSSNSDLRKKFFDFLKLKIEELSKESDIEFIGCGHTSLAFKIGDIVIKVGKEDNNHMQKRNYSYDCLIPVFFNQYFKVDEKEYYTIQISPLVSIDNITEEELYETYKRLRNYGYIWNDPTFDNVGRIIKDIEFNGHLYKKGDIVILDLEDLAYVGEETPDIVLEEIAIAGYNQKTYVYETRYIEEKKSKKK